MIGLRESGDRTKSKDLRSCKREEEVAHLKQLLQIFDQEKERDKLYK